MTQITKGSVFPSEMSQYHLKDLKANIDKVISYAEKRYLMTLLVSGAMKNTDMVRKQVYVDPDIWNTLKTIAKLKNVSMLEYMRDMMWDRYCSEYEKHLKK